VWHLSWTYPESARYPNSILTVIPIPNPILTVIPISNHILAFITMPNLIEKVIPIPNPILTLSFIQYKTYTSSVRRALKDSGCYPLLLIFMLFSALPPLVTYHISFMSTVKYKIFFRPFSKQGQDRSVGTPQQLNLVDFTHQRWSKVSRILIKKTVQWLHVFTHHFCIYSLVS